MPQSTVICFLLLLAIAQTFSWQLSCWFGPKVARQGLALSMSKKGLTAVREKFGGRLDLPSMTEEEDAFDFVSMDSLLSEVGNEDFNPPTLGQVIRGTVINLDDNGALLEMGGKMSGYLPLAEASLTPLKHVNEILQLGQEVEAEVIGKLKGMPVVSIRATQIGSAWEKVFQARAAEESFDVVVLDVNKGGAICDAFGLQAFLPGSHFVGVPDESLIGQSIKVKVLDVVEQEGKLVVSQKRTLFESLPDFKRGIVIKGTVTGLRDYGVFLELEGGMAGLLHISQISYDRVDKSLDKFFSIGQEIKVMVLDYDKATGKVALSTKALEANPGDMLKDMQAVFANAEETALRYNERMESERKAREEAAKDIVAGLGSAIQGSVSGAGEGGLGNVASVAESIESILASIVNDNKA
eukprot:gene7113-7865_t